MADDDDALDAANDDEQQMGEENIDDEEERKIIVHGKRYLVGPSDEDVEELWSLRTVELLRDLIENADVDQATGEVIVHATTFPQGVEISERFSSLEDLTDFLRQFGFQPGPGNQDFFGHDGLWSVDPWAVEEALEESEAAALFSDIRCEGDSIFKVRHGLLVPEIRLQLANVNEALVKYLATHPHLLHTIEPRRFEELVSELFRDFGYEVILTPRSRDGGFDIRAVSKDSVGTLLYLVECKRYQPNRRVGVELVRALHGVAAAEGASCGVLATTSYFTVPAREFASRVQYQLSLRDYNDLVVWLRQYPTRGRK